MIAPDGAVLFLDVENNDEGIQLDTTLHETNDNKIKFGISTNLITVAIWLILFWMIVRHEHAHGGSPMAGHPIW